MKKYLFGGLVIFIIIGLVFFLTNKKIGSPQSTINKQDASINEKNKNIFQDITDLCSALTKEQVSQLIGKPVVKTIPLSMKTLHSCQYYLNDIQAITINNDLLNAEKQKKSHQSLGRKIITNPKIPMDHFLVIQENNLINEIYLVLGPNNIVTINRTSAKTLSEDEMVDFAAKLAMVITGKTPLTKSVPTSTPSIIISTSEKNNTVPLPQETDIVRNFFNLIEEKRPNDAVSMMANSDESEKQAWAVQFNAINSKILNIDKSMPEEWTNALHTYKITVDVSMNPNSANAPIPYYGWENGKNIRWITLEKSGNLWKIKNIATGP